MRDKTPHSNFYKVDLLNDTKILSTRPRSFALKFGNREVMRTKKIDRHFEVHERSKKWVPGPSQYHYPTEKMTKMLSKGPKTIGFKYKGR